MEISEESRFKPSVARLEERALLSATTLSPSQVKVVPVIQYETIHEVVPVKGGYETITRTVPETIYVGEIAVTTLADDPTKLIRGQTTLRDAITLADANANANVYRYAITFDVKGTIKLAQALPDLTDAIGIVGPGVTIQQNTEFSINSNTGLPFSVLTVDAGAVASLSGMSFTVRPGLNPAGVGGIINNNGFLTLTATTVSNAFSGYGITYYGSGYAITNSGTMVVNDSTFTHNSSGSIVNAPIDDDFAATLTVTNSVFDNNNTATSIENVWGTATIIGSVFEHNSAVFGGAISDQSATTIQDSAFLYNSAKFGGAIWGDTGDVISSSIFVGNSATEGGAIYVWYFGVTVPPFNANDCIFIHNVGGNIYETYGGAGCFVAGTPVKTEHGLRPIEEIKAGDKVYAYDHATETWVLANVVKPLTHYGNISDFINIRLWTPIGSDTIKPTGNHPFWVTSGENLDARPAATDLSLLEQAMTPKGRWIEARNLRVGDTLLRSDNSIATIDDVCSSIEQSTVYNLEMEAIHSYTVGSASVLVHNAPGK